jgi:hypothetical protein
MAEIGDDVEIGGVEEQNEDAERKAREEDEALERRVQEERDKRAREKKYTEQMWQSFDDYELRRMRMTDAERAFGHRVKKPTNVLISEFTKVRWKNLSLKMKLGLGCVVFVFAFILLMSVVAAITFPMVLANQQSSSDMSQEVHDMKQIVNIMKARIDQANTTLTAIEQEVETVDGYTRVKKDVFCMRDYFLRPMGTNDEVAFKQAVACLNNAIINRKGA